MTDLERQNLPKSKAFTDELVAICAKHRANLIGYSAQGEGALLIAFEDDDEPGFLVDLISKAGVEPFR